MNKYKTKKLIAFDLDGTLSESRSKIDQEMADLLKELLKNRQVVIITGEAFGDIDKQVLSELKIPDELNKKVILLPTNGGGLWTFDNSWIEVASHKLSQKEKENIFKAIREVVDDTDEKCEIEDFDCQGEKVQDRNAQITYSARGYQASLETKRNWDPDLIKRNILQKELQKKLPHLEVKIGGKTSIDITPKGMDKAYGMRGLLEYTGLGKEDVLFLGDTVYEGGNDFPVSEMGIDSIKVSGPEETKGVIKKILES